jgi:hypothetical protein
VTVLKQGMMMKPDKMRGECENSQATEELAVYKKEVEQLQSCDKKWQSFRLQYVLRNSVRKEWNEIAPSVI